MKEAVIYVGRACPYCDMAKALLKEHGIVYREIMIATPELATEMSIKAGGLKTVPQIFFGNEHIGGYDVLRDIINNNELDKYIKN